MSRFKNLLFSIITIVIFFALAEVVSRLFIQPGSYSFIERRIIEENLTQKKNKDEFRIFLYGESTMQGHYLYPYSTIDKWLKLYLNDVLPGSVSGRVKIVNFGRIGSGSEFITTAFIDTIRYKPDLAVFYAANNDFCLFGNRREFFAKRSLKDVFEEFGKELPKHSAFLNVFNRLSIRAKMKRSKKKEAAANKLGEWCLEDTGDPEITESDLLYINSDKFNKIKTHFESNIRRAVYAAKRHSIPVVFLESVAKWKGYGPIRSFHDTALGKDSLAAWTTIYSNAEKAMEIKDYVTALDLYKNCLELDRAYALTYYRVGECYEGVGDPVNANKFYSIANDYDRYPIRAPSTVNQFYENLRGEGSNNVFIIETQKLFYGNSPDGIVGDVLIGDQIHPAINGQALIALSIVNILYEQDLIVPKKEWSWERLRGVEDMKKDLKLDNNGEIETHLAMAAYVKRDYVKAAAILEKALSLKPDSIFIKSWLAWTYWKGKEKAKALELYRWLYENAPGETSAFFDRNPIIKKEVVL